MSQTLHHGCVPKAIRMMTVQMCINWFVIPGFVYCILSCFVCLQRHTPVDTVLLATGSLCRISAGQSGPVVRPVRGDDVIHWSSQSRSQQPTRIDSGRVIKQSSQYYMKPGPLIQSEFPIPNKEARKFINLQSRVENQANSGC